MRKPTHLLLPTLSFLFALAGCGNAETSTTTGSGTAGTGGAGATGTTGTTGGDAGASSGGSTGTGTSTHTDPTTPDPQFLPKATGPCPDLATGNITVTPDGTARDVKIWIGDEAKTQDGPIVFFWHGLGGSPDDATYALGAEVIKEVVAMGGIVAAPVHDPNAGQFPWYLTLGGSNEIDLRVMDEVLACAVEKVGVDLRHIHSVGFSAGAMNNTQVGWRRSGYIASIVTFSGAQIGTPPDQDPTNLYPVMAFHGGPNDKVIINFKDGTEKYVAGLKAENHFAFICDHEMQHSVPAGARAPAWQFLKDHPFGITPEPYEKGLPASFPSYCTL